MWTPTTREQHSRKALRYQTDLTDAEWVMIEPHLPPAHGTGRPRLWPMREIVNGIFYVMRAGCPWRLLPSEQSGVGGDPRAVELELQSAVETGPKWSAILFTLRVPHPNRPLRHLTL